LNEKLNLTLFVLFGRKPK